MNAEDSPLCAMPTDCDDILQVQKAAMRVGEYNPIYREYSYLKVNKEKTVVSYVRGVKYLGYSFYVMKASANYGTSEVQRQDEVKAKRTDKSQ